MTPNFLLQSSEDRREIELVLQVRNSVGNTDTERFTLIIVREHTSYYYLTDHLGSIRVTVDTSGTAVGWDDYYPFGLQMPGRTQNANNPDEDIKFTGYELEQQCETDSSGGCINDVTLGLYHAGARMYDPVIGRFMQKDAFSNDYPSLSPYVYVANNPLIFVDPDGNHIVVAKNEDGTYSVVDGELDDDTSIYIQNEEGDDMEVLAYMMTTHSFFDDDGNVVKGANINMNSTEGQDFLDKLIEENPTLLDYAFNARNDEAYDFKVQGETDNMTDEQRQQHRYRGSVSGNLVGSARDYGNVGAGIVAGRHGLNWMQARTGFDGYQLYSDVKRGAIPSVEGPTTKKAQRIGHLIGLKLFQKEFK